MRRSLSVIMLLLAFAGAILEAPHTGRAQSQVYTDTMESAETGLLSTETFDPTISFTYANSQFVVDVQQPTYRGDIISTLNLPEMAGSRLTVDAFIEGNPANKYVIAGCRHTGAGEGYFFGYLPATGDILLWRRDATGDTNLAQSVEPSLIAPANTIYQIGVECLAGILTGMVNGQPVINAFDATYPVGRPTIGLGANGQQTDGLRVAFDNLSVEDLGNVQFVDAPTVTPTPGAGSAITTGQLAPIRDPSVDPAGTLADAFTISLEQPPVVSGLGGDVDVFPGSDPQLAAGVQLADFYAEIYYLTPDVPESTAYLVGFCFWTDPAGSCYSVFIAGFRADTPKWGYGKYTEGAEFQTLQNGDMPADAIDLTAGATNFLSLTVYQGVAILSSNTYAADVVIPLEGTPLAGDVLSEVGYVTPEDGEFVDPLPISTSGFAVWDLSSGTVPVVDGANPAATEQPAVVAEPTTGTTAVQLAPISDPAVDPEATLGDAFTISLEQPPVVSGLGEDRTLDLGGLVMQSAGVQLADFYAELYFTTPTLPPNTSYLVGFCFWMDPSGNCYDFYIQDMGGGVARWGYGYDQLNAEYVSLQVGDMPDGSLDSTPGATNFLSLTVYRGVAILSGNTYGVGAVVPLESEPIAGDVNAETGFLDLSSTAETPPLTVSISDFAVWDLSSGMVPVVEDTAAVATEPAAVVEAPTASGPVLPPLQSTTGAEALFDQTRSAVVLNPALVEGVSGSFTEEDGVYAYAAAGVSLADFYAIATFTNPTDGSAPFDIGLGFRDDRSSQGGLRFTVTSTGTWYMQLPGQEPYASGAATGFDATPGAVNTIEVLVQGGVGTVAINGVLLPQFDLSTVTTRGDVYLGAGFFQGDTVTGRVIAYSDWWIYPSDILDFPSG